MRLAVVSVVLYLGLIAVPAKLVAGELQVEKECPPDYVIYPCVCGKDPICVKYPCPRGKNSISCANINWEEFDLRMVFRSLNAYHGNKTALYGQFALVNTHVTEIRENI